MFIIDDLLLRALGLSLQPFDMIWIIELMRDYALKERYSIKDVNNRIKENRLLFEIGELTKEEYDEKHTSLLEELEQAKEITEKLSTNMKIQEM